MDNWCIVEEAEHPEAAYAWINFILDPENSLKDLEFHGYNTGIKGVQEAAEEAGLPFLDLVFFDDEQVATFRAGAVNSATETRWRSTTRPRPRPAARPARRSIKRRGSEAEARRMKAPRFAWRCRPGSGSSSSS